MGCQLLHLREGGGRVEAYAPAHQYLQQVSPNGLDVFGLKRADQFDNLLYRLGEARAGHDVFGLQNVDRFHHVE